MNKLYLFLKIQKTMFKSVGKNLKMIWEASPINIIIAILNAMVSAIKPFFFIIFPKFIIEELMGQKRIHLLISYILFMIIGYSTFSLLVYFFKSKRQPLNNKVNNYYMQKIDKHILLMDYEHMENPNIINAKMKAIRPINNNDMVTIFVDSFFQSIESILTIFCLIGILFTLNPLIIIVLLILIIYNVDIQSKIEHCEEQFEEEMSIIDRRYDYYDSLATDEKRAKDVRMYQMKPFLMKKISDDNTHILGNYFNKMFFKKGKYAGLSEIITQIQTIFIYAYMVISTYLNIITIGSMTMYLSSASKFASSVSVFTNCFMQLSQSCRYLENFWVFLDDKYQEKKTFVKSVIPSKIETITFNNVWFKYPNVETYTLKNISFTIRKPEKLSIVGENGAGKTTLIKLLCRFYKPEKGQILIDNIPIENIPISEYTNILTAVFQDFKLFAFTLEENISFDQPIDINKLSSLLNDVNLDDVILSMPKGIKTNIFKNFDSDGIELSGGQAQKLAIVRSCYKEASIMILDEPCASLDPYAEQELYKHFYHLSKDKMTFFISHRLSSCRFCDNILVLSNGEIIEYGTHEKLLSTDGLYKKMWIAQSEHYV